MVKVFSVRVGDKYGSEYEDYLRSKLPDITFINESIDPFFVQWNKIRVFNYDIDEPICVIDVDIELANDYMELFEYPIERGEFLSIPAHWGDVSDQNYKLNGGFYKFYPKDTKYIYDKFIQSPNWNTYYVEKLKLNHPLFGEQFFVEDSVKERLKLKLVPEDWVQGGLEDRFLNDGIVKFIHYNKKNRWNK